MSSSPPLLISAVQLCDSASVAGLSRSAFIIRIPMTGGYGGGDGGGGAILLKSRYEIGDEWGGQL